MTLKNFLFVGALAAAGLVVLGKVRTSYGIAAGIAMLAVANYLPDTTTAG